jgi:hypothetical protein
VSLVGQQGKRQVLFGLKFGFIFNSIGADANYDRIGRLKFLEIITDSLGLLGSAAGHSFGKEVEHHSLPLKIRQPGPLAHIIR